MVWPFSPQAHTGAPSWLITKIVSSLRMAGGSHAVAANRLFDIRYMIQGQKPYTAKHLIFWTDAVAFKGWLHASESSSCWKQAVHWQWSHHPKRKAVAILPSHAESCLPHWAPRGSCHLLQKCANAHRTHALNFNIFQCISGVFALLMTLAKNRSCTGLARAAISYNLCHIISRDEISWCLAGISRSTQILYFLVFVTRLGFTLKDLKGSGSAKGHSHSVSRRHAQVLGSNGLAPSVRALKALVWGTLRNYSTVGYCRYIFVCAALCMIVYLVVFTACVLGIFRQPHVLRRRRRHSIWYSSKSRAAIPSLTLSKMCWVWQEAFLESLGTGTLLRQSLFSRFSTSLKLLMSARRRQDATRFALKFWLPACIKVLKCIMWPKRNHAGYVQFGSHSDPLLR